MQLNQTNQTGARAYPSSKSLRAVLNQKSATELIYTLPEYILFQYGGIYFNCIMNGDGYANFQISNIANTGQDQLLIIMYM